MIIRVALTLQSGWCLEGEHGIRWNVAGIVASAHAVWARLEGTRQFDKEAQSQIDYHSTIPFWSHYHQSFWTH